MDFNYLKRRNSLFDAPKPVGSYPPFDFAQADDQQNQDKLTPLPAPTPDASSRFSSTYADLADEKGGPAQQKYNDFLGTGPNREDFQPTKMGRIGAILAGMSDGVKHGGGVGVKTTQDILDDPYNQAQKDYDLKAKKLEASAGLEEKDMGRRVGILRDITTQQKAADALAETKRVNDSRIKNYDSQALNRGVHYTDITDPNSGHKSSVKLNPDGTKQITDLGIGAFTPDQQTELAGKKAGAASKATEGSRIRVAAAGISERANEARKTADHKFENIQELLQWKQDNGIGDKYEGRVNKDGKLVYINKSDPADFHVTDIDTGKMSDKDKQAARIELKKTAAPDKTKTTDIKRDKNGKVISTSTTTKETGGTGNEEDLGKKAPPPGGKPGGKWSKMKSGALIYTEPD